MFGQRSGYCEWRSAQPPGVGPVGGALATAVRQNAMTRRTGTPAYSWPRRGCNSMPQCSKV